MCGRVDGLKEEFQKTVGDIEHGNEITTDPSMSKGEYKKRFENCFIRDMPKAFRKLQVELQHLLQCLYVAGKDGTGCLISVLKAWILYKLSTIPGVRAAKFRFIIIVLLLYSLYYYI